MFSSLSSCSRDLLLWIENYQFGVLYPAFLLNVFSRKKYRVDTVIILYMDDTLEEKDVLLIFEVLEIQK